MSVRSFVFSKTTDILFALLNFEDLCLDLVGGRELAAQVAEETGDCAYIGEAPYDIQAGVASGIFTIAVPSGTWSRQSLAECCPDQMIDVFSDLTEYLQPADVEE